jgi:hypothetical protein
MININILKQRQTYIYLVLSALSMIAALIVSISDNPPGIILSFMSSILFVLAFTHNWKKPKPYIILLISSVFGFVLFAVLHNVFEVIGKGTFWEVIGAFFFLLAIFLCPAGIIIGIVGSIITAIKNERENTATNI